MRPEARGVLPPEDVAYAMGAAAREGHVEVVAAFIHWGCSADLAWDGVTPLMQAARSGQAAVIHLLLDSGANPDAADPAGWTALFHAARAQQADAVRALLARGASSTLQDCEGRTALYAARTQHFGVRLGSFLIGGVRRRWRLTAVARLLRAAGTHRS